MTTITALPTPPSRSDPANFPTRADAFLAALPTFVTETNTVAGEINAALSGKASSASPTFTGNVDASGATAVSLPAGTTIGNVSATELSYLDGVTSAIQTQLGDKISAGAITGGSLTMSTARLLGRTTSGTGAVEEISVGTGLTLSGGALSATSAMVYLSTVTASGAATADIETTFDATYDAYVIVGSNVYASSGGAINLRMKLSGAYDTGANYYYSQGNSTSASATPAGNAGAGVAQIQLISAVGTSFTSAADIVINVGKPTGTYFRRVFWQGSSYTGTALVAPSGAGINLSSAVLSGIRIYPSAGTLTGTFRLYGIKNS